MSMVLGAFFGILPIISIISNGYLLGFVAMGIILSIPDNFEVYKPVFHVKTLWLLAMGISLLLNGVNIPERDS